MAAAPAGYFSPATFKFLHALARHNDRTWFQTHKPEYEQHVKLPLLRLIDDLAGPLHGISPHILVDPRAQGGSMFRIYRDTRFARDKRPYKEWAAARFLHERNRELSGDVPCFYVHLQPGDCYVGGGLWHPQPATLKRVRAYLINNPTSWKAATRSATFRRHMNLGGDTLQRPPQGYDPDHELIEDLKRKDFVAGAAIEDERMLQSDLPRHLMTHYRRVAPMVDWLCGALDLDF